MVHTISKTTIFPGILKFFNVHPIGLHKILENESYIFAMNHQSALDIFLAHSLIVPKTNRHLSILIENEAYDVPVLKWLFKRWKFLRVNRKNGKPKDNTIINRTVKRIENGYNVLVFPEGKIKGGRYKVLLRPYTGVIKLALLTKKPIIPIGIQGSWKAWRFPNGYSNKRTILNIDRKQPVYMKIGDKIDLSKYYSIDISKKTKQNKILLRDLSNVLMEKLSLLSQQPYVYNLSKRRKSFLLPSKG